MTFSPEQLNFLKFSSVVLDEFPVTLRSVFVFMWDAFVATTPGVPKWDDSTTVHNMFLTKEGGSNRAPKLNKSFKEWDCTALFKATLFAQTFAMPDRTGGVSTLDRLYVRPLGLSAGTFHSSVRSSTGNQAETCALALDQLRRLRNELCHLISTREIDKATFAHYLSLAKDAFTVLGQNTSRIDEIGKLAEDDFPIAKLKQLEEDLKREKDAAITFKQIDDNLIKIESKVEDVGSDVKDVKKKLEDVGSDMKGVKTGVTNVKTQVKNVSSNVKDVKTGVTNMKTQKENVGSQEKDVKTQVEDDGSDVKYVTTRVPSVQTQVEDVDSDVKDVKTGVTDVQTQVENVGSDVKDVKTGVTDIKTQREDILSDVKGLKADVAHKQQAKQWEGSKGPLFSYSCMPAKIQHFVGRQKECQVILDHLTNRGTRLVDIWGPPGYGKTSVAINVAHRLQEMGIPTFFTCVRGIKSKDGLVSKFLSIFADARQAVYVSPSHWLMQCLQQLRNPFVLVLDNADDLVGSGDAKLKEDVLRFTEEILTQCSHIKLLFTTRESLDYLSHKIPVHNERVGVLDVVSSLTLVRSLSPNVSEDNCSSIVRVCGQVPLAVRLMCSIMTQEHVPLNELLEERKISPTVEVLNVESFPDNARLKNIINKLFERLSNHERDALVSLAVFPGSFGIEEATAVLDSKTLTQIKTLIRSLKRKSLVDCTKDFSTFTVHSLLRSFIDDRRTTNQETGDTFRAAQRRFYSHHISRFERANEKFLTGQSNEALTVFLKHRDSMILSLIDGLRDEELYPKAVEVLSKAELFLFGLLPVKESLFKTIYDTALKEAKKRQEVRDEGKLLAAKSFSHWGWFSSDHQTCDDSFSVGLTISAGCCPAKLLCYFGINQLLGGKLDEGISSLQQAANSLSSSCDETILKQLVYAVLATSYIKKGEHKMTSYFSDLSHKTIAKASSVGTCLPNDILSSLRDNGFFHDVIATLLCLLLSERKSLNHGFLHAMGALYKLIYSLSRKSFLDLSLLETFWEDRESTRRLNANKLSEELLIPTNLAIALESFFHATDNLLVMHPSSTTLFHFNQLLEKALLPYLETLSETYPEVLMIVYGQQPFIQIEKEALRTPEKLFGDDPDPDFEDLARTYDILGKVWYLVKNYSRAIESHQRAIKVREENIGNHVDTSSSLTNIGCLQFEMSNEVEGVKSFQRAFELREQFGIYDHVDTANIYFTLGNKHRTLANYEKAIEAHLQALELRKKHLGEHSLTGKSLQTIAEVYYEKGVHSVTSHCNSLQRFPHLEAWKFCSDALGMRLKLEEHVNAAKSFYLLGWIFCKSGDMRSALTSWKYSLYKRSTHLGDHQDTARSYHSLGVAQCETGDFNGALESLQKALQLRRKLSIADDADIANVTNDIGHVYFIMGNYQFARKHFRDAVDLHKKLLGKHKSTASSYHNLALTYFVTRSYPKVLECYRQASAIRLEILGEHVHTADSFYALGGVYYHMGDFKSALEAFQKASDIRSNLLGDHPDMVRSYYYVGVAQFYTGDFEGALESLQKALKLGNRLKLYPGVADIINNLGRVHLKMGDYQSARKRFQKAVILNKMLRGEHVDTANSCHNLTSTYLLLGSYPKALKLCQQALSMRLELLGHKKQTLKSLETLECIHLRMGNISSAVEVFCSKASDIKCNGLGDDEVAGSYLKDWKCSIS